MSEWKKYRFTIEFESPNRDQVPWFTKYMGEVLADITCVNVTRTRIQHASSEDEID